MQFDEVLRTFSGFFGREGIRYAVIGGLAMQAWGSSRFTKDADLVVDAANRERVIAFAESLGYETLHVSAGYSNHLHSERRFGRVDFLYLDDVTAGQVFERAVMKPIVGDVMAPVPRPEHLAMMLANKIANDSRAGRERGVIAELMAAAKGLPPVEPLDTFEQDVPTTPEDIAALERVRELNYMDPHTYLEFLLAFSKNHPPSRETNSPDDEPFTL